MDVKLGKSIEITKQLSGKAASTLAQWIGSSTVIYNQKTMANKEDYFAWIDAGKEGAYPISNQQVAYLTDEFDFLKDIPSQIRRNAGSKWFEALNAFKKGLRKPPKVKPKHRKRNCYVTSELFDIQDLPCKPRKEGEAEAVDDGSCVIHIKEDATNKNKGNFLCGVVMPFSKAKAGNSFYLSRKGSRFWLSMAYDKTLNVLSPPEVKSLVLSFSDAQLEDLTTGFDLGVAKQVVSSEGLVYHYNQDEVKKLEKLEKKRQKYQKRYAKKALKNDIKLGKKRKRTATEKKLSQKIAKYDEKRAEIRYNRSHHISKKIAKSVPLIAVFEDLKIQNMVRKAKAKQDPETGKWLRNNASAKSGLNKAILNVNWGQIRDFSEYKLKNIGKILIKVNPAHTSQECSLCGFIDKGNRKTQAEFKCLECSLEMNADHNAALVIKKRGIAFTKTEKFAKVKTVKKISIRKTKVPELASLGGGGHVSQSLGNATTNETLNPQLSFST